jgi:cell division protein FtsQ
VAAVLAVVAILAGGWVWLRSSSLVAVQRVTITGVSGPDASQIRSALVAAAHGMTTLNVKMGALHTAVAPYPVVKQLRVSTDFPHRIRIAVVEQVPVAEVTAAGRRFPVSGDGTLLHDASVTESLPTIAMSVAPGGSRVDGATLSEVKLLAAAPYTLLAKVSQASRDGGHGLGVQLRNGPRVYFGDATDLRAKWAAAAAVLSAPGSAGADYVDVSDPDRPAAGSGSDTAAASSSSASGTSGGPSAVAGQGSPSGSAATASTGAASATTGVTGGG